MKHLEKHIINLLVTIALFLVFGNVASAGEIVHFGEKLTNVSGIQEEDHDKPFIFNELAIGEVSQTVSQNEYSGLDLYGTYCSNQNFSFAHICSNYNCFYSSKDKRELIFRHIFPFHFFW